MRQESLLETRRDKIIIINLYRKIERKYNFISYIYRVPVQLYLNVRLKTLPQLVEIFDEIFDALLIIVQYI